MLEFKSYKTWEEVPTLCGGFQATLAISYDRLVSIFGEPELESVETKTETQWAIQFPDCTIATIYNWKNGKKYLGDDGKDVQDITEWHIGGKNYRAVTLIKQVLSEN